MSHGEIKRNFRIFLLHIGKEAGFLVRTELVGQSSAIDCGNRQGQQANESQREAHSCDSAAPGKIEGFKSIQIQCLQGQGISR